MTRNSRTCANSVTKDSVNPSARYSWEASPDRFWKGKTATEWIRPAGGILVSIVVLPVRLMIGLFISAAGMAVSTPGIGVGIVTGIVGVAIFFCANWIYEAAMESSSKQATVGKMALGLRVTDLEGRRISFARATGRHFAKIISGMTLLIGYIMAGFTERKQALHDMIAGTLVQRTQ